MKFKVNCTMSVWLSDIKIEADTEEEALDKLYNMDAKDLIKDGFVEDYTLSDEEVKGMQTTFTFKVKVSKIDYIKDSNDDDLSKLPKEFEFTIKDIEGEDDLDDSIVDEIYTKTRHDVNSYTLKVIKKY